MALRRTAPTWWQRVMYGAVTGVGATTVAATVSGLLTSGISATGTVVAAPIVVLVVVACLAIGTGAAYVRGRLSQLPDSLIDDAGADSVYKCGFCTEGRLREAVDLTKPYYGHEYVAPDVAVQWLMKSPKGFVQIINSYGELCASFGILGLTPSFTEQFMAGKVSDTELSSQDILSLDKAKRSESLYISGVVVRDSSRHRGHKRAGVMLWCMLHYMKTVYGLRRTRRLYAVAVNRKSEQMMKNFGFQLQGRKDERVDRCPIYVLTLTKKSWAGLIQKIPDYSQMCRCNFRVSRKRPRSPGRKGAGAGAVTSESGGSLPEETGGQVTVLFIAGDRGGSQRNQIQTPREFDNLGEALGGSKHRDKFTLATPIQAATLPKLAAAYRDRPTVLHFAGHGDDRSLSLVVDQGLLVTEAPIVGQQLVRILGSFPVRIRFCVLNACASAPIARLLVDARVVDLAVGWPGKVVDATAIAFSRALYRCLGDGLTISQSVTLAIESCNAGEPPILHVGSGVDTNVNPFVAGTDA